MIINKDNIKNFKNGLYYMGGAILQLFIAFFTQPIFSMNLSSEDFGIIAYYSAIQGGLNPLILLGLPQIFLMNFYRNSKEVNEKNLFNSLCIQSIFGLIFSLLSILVLWYIFSNFDINVDLFPYIYLVLVLLYFNNYKSFYLLNLRVRKKGLSFLLITTLPIIISTLTGLYFVVHLQMGAFGRMLGTACGSLFTGLVSIWVLRKYTIHKVDWSFLKINLSKIVTLTLSAYAFFPIRNIDKIFLERLDNISELGYFGIGSRIATMVFLAGNALHSAFEPDYYKAVSNSNYKKLYKTAALYTGTLLFGIIIFLFISEYVVDFFTAGRYTRAYIYANYLVVGVFFMLLFGIINSVITAKKRVKDLLLINILGGLGALLANYFLINQWGFMGGCYAKIATGIILSLIALTFLILNFNKIENEKRNS
jgi:O-antigen/teichoic acid export membrane protein